ALDSPDDFGIGLAGLFGLEEMDGFLIDFAGYVVVTIDRRVKILYKLEIPPHVVIPYGCIAGGLIGDVHVMALIHQVDERAAHRDHVIVWVGRKKEYVFAGRLGAFGPVAVVYAGFAAGPAGNGMLQCIKDLGIDVISGAFVGQQRC